VTEGKRPRWFPLLLAVACFVVYANVYENQFLWDDEHLIEKNVLLENFDLPEVFSSGTGDAPGRPATFYRPMQIFAYFLVSSAAGLESWAFHLLNVLLHACNAILLFLLLRRITANDTTAFIAALLWVVHPIHTEAITYMSGTADPLATLFGLLCFLFYLKFRQTKVSRKNNFYKFYGEMV